MHRTTATAAPRGRLTAAAALLLTLGALLGLSPAPAGAAPVYHSSEEWAWLEHPGQVIPGGRILNVDGGGSCSTGFLVGHGPRRFILTAGHCGDVGDRFAVDDARGAAAWAGQMVESAYERVGGVDIGLIELTGTAPAEATPPVEEPLLGWAGADWLERTRPTICRLGYRTGLSCGDYLGVDEAGIVHYEASPTTATPAAWSSPSPTAACTPSPSPPTSSPTTPPGPPPCSSNPPWRTGT